MRCQGRNDDLDGLSEQDRARIDAAARASVTPGLEGLAPPFAPDLDLITDVGPGPIRSSDPLPGKPVARKRGQRT